jgi:hypothetical protein
LLLLLRGHVADIGVVLLLEDCVLLPERTRRSCCLLYRDPARAGSSCTIIQRGGGHCAMEEEWWERRVNYFSLFTLTGLVFFFVFGENLGDSFGFFLFFFNWLASPINSPLFMRGTPTYLFIGKLICYYFFSNCLAPNN